jgi:hypothetical protein
MNNINIKTGLYAICDKYNEVDIIKCCLKQCEEQINLCYEHCTDEYNKNNDDYLLFKCKENCIRNKNNCHNVCLLGNENIWNEHNNYSNCIKKICNNINNTKCIKDNHLKIKDCFVSNCKLNRCKKFYDIIDNLNNNHKNLMSYRQTNYKPIKHKNEDHTWKYIIITTFIALIIVFFIYKF